MGSLGWFVCSFRCDPGLYVAGVCQKQKGCLVAIWTTALENCAKRCLLAENLKPREIFHGGILVIEKVKADSNTDWTSSLHLVNKPGGGVRPCSDFRELNKKTVTDAFPLPLLKDFTKKLHGAKHFSVIDLKSAFFNIPIWPEHRHLTTTLDPWGGAYVYNRLAFGLSSGPSSWQKLIETVSLVVFPQTLCNSLILVVEHAYLVCPTTFIVKFLKSGGTSV